ncbi:hypothetical protein U1Q18_004647 [Sarracenia purpurea var. burkii]
MVSPSTASAADEALRTRTFRSLTETGPDRSGDGGSSEKDQYLELRVSSNVQGGYRGPKPRRDLVADWVSKNDDAVRNLRCRLFSLGRSLQSRCLGHSSVAYAIGD